jgi:hypothetical protein
MGALEEGGKAIGGVVDAMRSQPLAIALVLMNLGLLVYLYYYTNRITSRTEMTAQALFDANNKLYAQFGTIIKDTNILAEKTIHCILPSDALQLLQAPRPYSSPPPAAPERPQEPQRPQAPRGDLKIDPPKPAAVEDPPKPINFGDLPIPIDPPSSTEVKK